MKTLPSAAPRDPAAPLQITGQEIVDLVHFLDRRAREAYQRRAYEEAADIYTAAAAAAAAVRLSGTDDAAMRGHNRAVRHLVPRWHFQMMNDAARNAAFLDGIQKTIRPGALVLDIGTGAGLLALLAARAGAGHVYTCEQVGMVADTAREIIARNGLQDRITVIGKPSNELRVGKELPRRVDVLITEIFDCGLLGEGVAAALAHGRRELLAADGAILPGRASVQAVLVDSPAIHQLNHVDEVLGFDLSPFNRFRTLEYFSSYLAHHPHRALCAPFPVFEFDLGRDIQPEARALTVPITADGVCHAVCFWFELSLADGVHLSNAPEHHGSHWRQAIQSFAEPRRVQRGDTLRIEARHDGERILFQPAGARPPQRVPGHEKTRP